MVGDIVWRSIYQLRLLSLPCLISVILPVSIHSPRHGGERTLHVVRLHVEEDFRDRLVVVAALSTVAAR